MKHQIKVQIETGPGQYRYVTAHCESWHDEDRPDIEHRLEMECALDDAGNYCSVPSGFWAKVERHMWAVWLNSIPHAQRGDCRRYFPQFDEISLSIEEQYDLVTNKL